MSGLKRFLTLPVSPGAAGKDVEPRITRVAAPVSFSHWLAAGRVSAKDCQLAATNCNELPIPAGRLPSLIPG